MESIEGGMHGWGDSCVTEDRASCTTLTGISVQDELTANSKYAVNVNGHSQRHQQTSV